MIEQRYNWMIEWLPDDPENLTTQYYMVGTREDAEKESERRHPGYLCKEIVFHRRGKANVKDDGKSSWLFNDMC